MNGVHDMDGLHGFGTVAAEANEPVFQERGEARIFGLNLLRLASGFANIDAGRHAMERIAPAEYLTLGDCGRWLRSLETLLLEAGVLAEGELDARIEGQELWGDQAVPRSFVQPDLFESHLEAEA